MTETTKSTDDVLSMTESADEESSLFDLVIAVIENIKLIAFGSIAVGVLTMAYTFYLKPVYTAKAVILPPQQQQSSAAVAMQSLGALASLAGAAGVKNPADQYVALMQSVTVSERVINAFHLGEVYGSPTRQGVLEKLADNVKLSSSKKDNLITIEVDDTDPKRAADMANNYVDQLRRFTNELAVTEAQQRRVFFERQLRQTRDKLTEAQRNLQASGINEGALRTEPKAAAESYAALKAQVTAAEVRLRAMRGYLTEEAPEFKLAQSSLSALQSQLSKAEAADGQAGVSDYIGKYREFKYQETLFELFAKQFELAKLDESRDGALIQVVDPAFPPERQSKPKRALTVIAATVSAGLVFLIFALVRNSWRQFASNEESAEKLERLRAAWRR